MFVKKVALYLFILSTCSFWLLAQESLPKLSARAMDFTNTLSKGEISALETKLKQFEEEKGSQMVVLVISTTGNETIEQYGIRLADAWKIGREKVDDGVILIIAINDRKMRVEVGYGLEGAIPDALAKRIISLVITPEFRAGHFYKGIDLAMDALIAAASDEELPPAVAQRMSSATGNENGNPWFAFYLVAYVLAFTFVKMIFDKKVGKKKSKWFTTLTMFVILLLLAGLFVAIVVSVLSMLFLGTSGRTGSRGMRAGGWYMGGGGFSGGGGGFGGFSGGGGGFGGGGASGGW